MFAPGRSFLLALILLFWGLTLYQLENWPLVYQDEPWQAAPGYGLVAHGVFGAEIFAGFDHMDTRHYAFLPLFSLLLAGIFRIVGAGLFQVRLAVAWLSVMILALTYMLGRRLGGTRVGLLAVVLLLTLRVIAGDVQRPTGIPLLDLARIGRYDTLVPVCGLLAIGLIGDRRAWSSSQRITLHSTAIGLLLGLSMLAHPVGWFWAVAVLALGYWAKMGWRNLLWIGLVIVLVWVPWLAFMAGDPPGVIAQTRGYADRFDLLRPGFYLENLAKEWQRYPLGLRSGTLLRPGLWFLLGGLPVFTAQLGRRAWRGNLAARSVVVPLGIVGLGLAVAVTEKYFNHTASLWPLVAIALAWGFNEVASLRFRSGGRSCLANGLENGLAIVLPLVVGLAVYEGTTQIAHSLLTAGRVTPYRVYTARIAQYFKPSDRVLGSHTWWLGLLGVDYRSFVVPFWLDDPRYSAEPVSFGQALALLHPNVVLLDPTMTAFFANAADPLSPNYRRYLDYQAYLVAHQAQLAGQVQDPTYGTTQVYRLASP